MMQRRTLLRGGALANSMTQRRSSWWTTTTTTCSALVLFASSLGGILGTTDAFSLRQHQSLVLPTTTLQVNRHFTYLPPLCTAKSDDDTSRRPPLPPPRAKLLPKVLRYRGRVDKGYGRGGKQLGVPTANLKAGNGSSSNLDRVDTGVYFGWAMLEHGETAFSVPYKAVVNVGYSPTFEGQENPEKIIEAHLITPQDDDDDDDDLLPDFYGTPLRLQLVGFLRDEQKFDSLSDLMAQIHADVRDARDALECDPYDRCRQDDFFRVDRWVGKGDGDASGGDDQASWESQTMTEFLNAL